ncbi:MAG TPA: TnpV protein [Candidatus Scatavimonas merdigallinarum]|uniref:TnpV protein n=1 Tax=Candidatus Scatavimonas merdigallinarum TaxID=2840914 RepID=A0A9D0ZGP6_9FIRM|nr:TnpV protein [Candidatus Scatavimonas merdigallinarum]
MERSLFEQMGGTYTQVGDYMLPDLILSEQEHKSIGIWGQRHANYLKQHHKVLYMNLLTSGKLNSYLADIDERAENMFSRLLKQMAEKQGITEQLKVNDQMIWVGRMNAVRNAATEIVNKKLIYI